MTKQKNKLIRCADGFHMSVQGNEGAYCEPRDDHGPYSQVEVGFPNKTDDLLLPYAENKKKPTQTVYGWVPKSVVINVIVKHGGMISGSLPAGFPYLYAPGVQNPSI